MWDLLGPGIEPPKLAGGFLTTVQPGKSSLRLLKCQEREGRKERAIPEEEGRVLRAPAPAWVLGV